MSFHFLRSLATFFASSQEIFSSLSCFLMQLILILADVPGGLGTRRSASISAVLAGAVSGRQRLTVYMT